MQYILTFTKMLAGWLVACFKRRIRATQWAIADGLDLSLRMVRRNAIIILICHGGDSFPVLAPQEAAAPTMWGLEGPSPSRNSSVGAEPPQ